MMAHAPFRSPIGAFGGSKIVSSAACIASQHAQQKNVKGLCGFQAPSQRHPLRAMKIFKKTCWDIPPVVRPTPFTSIIDFAGDSMGSTSQTSNKMYQGLVKSVARSSHIVQLASCLVLILVTWATWATAAVLLTHPQSVQEIAIIRATMEAPLGHQRAHIGCVEDSTLQFGGARF